MSEKLKPCPFCGNLPGEMLDDGVLHVRCRPCGVDYMRLTAWNRRELESASQPGVGEAASVVCINAKELADVLELAAPDAFPLDFDRDHEQMDTEMCIGRLTGSLDDDGSDTGPGLFAWYTEYPEEGVIPLRLDRDVRASIDAAMNGAAPSAGNGGAEGDGNA